MEKSCPSSQCDYTWKNTNALYIHWGMKHEGDCPIEYNKEDNPNHGGDFHGTIIHNLEDSDKKEEALNRMSRSIEELHEKGNVYDEEWKEKAKANIPRGEDHWNYEGDWTGKKWHEMDEDTKEKVIEGLKGREISWKDKLSESMRGREPYCPKRRYVPEFDDYFDSGWEVEIAKILKENGVDYEKEPTFHFENGRSYTPDFKCDNLVIEVKGQVHDSCIERAEKFREEYPEHEYVVIGDYYSKIPCDKHFKWEDREKFPEWVEEAIQ